MIRRGALLTALALVAALLAPAALAAPQGGAEAASAAVASQAKCLSKQWRKHGGPEGGRASALKAHFDCFPADPSRFVALFDGAGPLAADHSAHFELFFAARPAIGERAWSTKAVGVLADGEWRAGPLDLYTDLLLMQMKARAPALLDAAGKLDDITLAAFWRALFGSEAGLKPDAAVCAGREGLRACAALAALAP